MKEEKMESEREWKARIRKGGREGGERVELLKGREFEGKKV